MIPYDRWQPLSVADVAALFAGAPFSWGLGGGYAVELFLGRAIRAHGDIDVVVFHDQQRRAQRWLAGWELHAADPPGTLRPWAGGEQLPAHIHDIWGHRAGAQAWEMQLMLADASSTEWLHRHNHSVRGPRAELLVPYGGLPCVRIEVQLLYKAKSRRAKDTLDFEACLPLLDTAARSWLRAALQLNYASHPWLAYLL